MGGPVRPRHGRFPPNGNEVLRKWKSCKRNSQVLSHRWIAMGRDSMYVRDEPFRAEPAFALMVEVSPSAASVVCGGFCDDRKAEAEFVIERMSTPEDFNLHELRTMGTAKGPRKHHLCFFEQWSCRARYGRGKPQFMDVVCCQTCFQPRALQARCQSHSQVLLVTVNAAESDLIMNAESLSPTPPLRSPTCIPE